MSEIAELFDRDPLHLTDQDLGKIIAHMRENRERFLLEKKPATAKPKAVSLKQKLNKVTEIDLSELGL